MNRFTTLQLTEARTPQFLSKEEGVITESNVTIFEGENRTIYVGGTLTLTSHRLLWVSSGSERTGIQLDLKHVVDFAIPKGLLSAFSQYVVVNLHNVTVHEPLVPSSSATFVKLHFGSRTDISKFKKTAEAIFANLLKAAAAAPAHSVSPSPQQQQADIPSLQFLGIRGIMQRQELELKKSEQDIRNAFADLKSLMDKAKDMVSLVQLYSTKQAKVRKDNPSSDESDDLQQFAVSLGIAAPVTRESHGTGSRYICDLSLQLAEFLRPVLAKYGGILTVPDVYCLFNRARGTYLVSPEDMLQACEQFEKLSLPVRYTTLPSGVRVVQSLAYSIDEIAAVVSALLRTRAFLSAADLAIHRGNSVTLCAEQLLALERAGVLCRDDTIHGLLFFPNRFAEV